MASDCQTSKSILCFVFLLVLTADYVNAKPHARRLSSPPTIDQGTETSLYLRIFGSVSLVVFLIFTSICFCLRHGTQENQPNVVVREVEGAKQFDLGAMMAATSNFSIVNSLGEGRLGVVYKGKLDNGQEVAIKRLTNESPQEITEFINEAHLVAKLQHKNLVRLVGFCVEGEERMLVYEFVPNLSLDKHLFDRSKSKHLTWEVRHKIILGIANGLRYLHEDPELTIRQCDLKASNILLEHDFSPKISNVVKENCDIESEVYSFGVLLLEIVSGQQYDNELEFQARKLWEEGRIDELVDSTLQMNVSRVEITRIIEIGLLCVRRDSGTRPKMQAVLLMLDNNSC